VLSWYFPRERRRWWRETVGNCSITRLDVENGSATLRAFDETRHLAALEATAHQRNYTLSGDKGDVV
jgi:broad specificity phosphatase PhoE